MPYRLDPLQHQALSYALANLVGEVYLFGSRTDQTKTGGDVDIFVINHSTSSNMTVSMHITNKYTSICDEKIDVVVCSLPFTLYDEAFFTSITKVPLCLSTL